MSRPFRTACIIGSEIKLKVLRQRNGEKHESQNFLSDFTKQKEYSRKFIRKLTLDYRVMKCKECGTGLRRYDGRGLKTALKEYANLFAKSGFIKGGYRVYNFWQGHYSGSLYKVIGYYYCPKCKTYRIICPNCRHNLQLGKDYPVQGNKYICPHCKKDIIFYDKELDNFDFDNDEYE